MPDGAVSLYHGPPQQSHLQEIQGQACTTPSGDDEGKPASQVQTSHAVSLEAEAGSLAGAKANHRFLCTASSFKVY